MKGDGARLRKECGDRLVWSSALVSSPCLPPGWLRRGPSFLYVLLSKLDIVRELCVSVGLLVAEVVRDGNMYASYSWQRFVY